MYSVSAEAPHCDRSRRSSRRFRNIARADAQGQVDLAARLTRRDGSLVEAEGAGETLPAAAPNAIALRRARANAVVDRVADMYDQR